MIIRQGRKNPRNLYVQLDVEPSDRDISIGYIRLPAVAACLVDSVNNYGATHETEQAAMDELHGELNA